MLSEVASEDPDKEKLRMFQPEEARAFMENIVPETVKSWRNIFTNLKIYSKSTLKILKMGMEFSTYE